MKSWSKNWITKFNPLVSSNDMLSKLLRLKKSENENNSDQKEMDLNIESDQLDDHEIRMIKGVFRLDRTIVREIMIPRVDIVSASTTVKLKTLSELMMTSGHSKIPIYDSDIDHMKGIAYARDVLGLLLKDASSINRKISLNLIRPALFVPETKILDELLTQFQQEQVHIAIVMDEYGGVSGIVTIEDLLEEIVGEIEDEFDFGDPNIEKIDSNNYIIDGKTSLEQVNELLSIDIEGDGFDTIGGLVYQRLGKIPSVGDDISIGNLNVEVTETVGRRVKKLVVKVI
jgi:CBS domain containing-hemolysin-like protein